MISDGDASCMLDQLLPKLIQLNIHSLLAIG